MLEHVLSFLCKKLLKRTLPFLQMLLAGEKTVEKETIHHVGV